MEAGKELGDSPRGEAADRKEDRVVLGSWVEVRRAEVGTAPEGTEMVFRHSSLVAVEEAAAEGTDFQMVAAHMKSEAAGNDAG